MSKGGGHPAGTARSGELERLVDLAVDMLCVATMSGRFLVVNPAWFLTLGYHEHDLRGRRAIDLTHPDDRERTLAETAKLITPGVELTDFENRFLHSDGSYRWLVWGARSDGERMYAVARDVTERKRVEERMQEANSRFRGAFENAPIGMALFGLARGSGHRPFQVNRAACELLRRSEQELLTSVVPAEVVYPPDLEIGRDQIRSLLRGETESCGFEKRFVRGDGSVMWANVRLSLVRDGGGRPDHGICQFHDVTDRREAYEALRSSDERLRTVVETTNEGIWTLDAHDRTSFVNARMAEMVGYTVEEMLGTSVFEFVDHEGEQAMRARLARRRRGVSDQYERRFVGKDGQEVFTIVNASPLASADGSYAGSFAMVTDVTERTRHERAVQASEERYRNIIETTTEGVWMIDSDHRTTYVNARMAEMLGYSVDEMLGKPVAEFMPEPSDAAAAPGADPREVRYRRKDGSEMWGLRSGSPLTDGSGAYGGALAMITDITERKRSDEAVARLAALVDASPDAMFSTDLDGLITSWNSAAERIYGYSEAEAVGQPVRMLSPPERAEQSGELARALCAGESVVAFHTDAATKDGRTIAVAPSISAIRDAAGEVVGAVAIVRTVP
jgi:PAS domain S-box-containing protein